MMRIASFLLIAVLATTCVISGTFAKYTSDFTGSSTARVAKWAFTINEGEMNATGNFNFNLFESVTAAGNNDENVKDGVSENIIAPGTSGSFQITLVNKSEVTATYKVQLSETNAAGIPIEYSTNGSNWFSLEDFNDAQTATEIAMTNGQAIVTVHWRWAFNTSDDQNGKDTTLGWNGTATVKTTATITVTQVD